jgi:uncharacterized membrane protein YccC
MNKKALAVWMFLLGVIGVSVVWILWPSSKAQPSAPAPRGAVKAKARSSKALAALLKPANNVEAPVEAAALAAMRKDERARREQQTSVLLGVVNPRLSAVFQPLDVNPKARTKEEVKAKFNQMMGSVGKTAEALEQSLEELTNDPATAALVEKVDAQLTDFDSAGVAEREAQLPELRANLENVIDLVVAKAKTKLGR